MKKERLVRLKKSTPNFWPRSFIKRTDESVLHPLTPAFLSSAINTTNWPKNRLQYASTSAPCECHSEQKRFNSVSISKASDKLNKRLLWYTQTRLFLSKLSGRSCLYSRFIWQR